jgi:hypothetical protein
MRFGYTAQNWSIRPAWQKTLAWFIYAGSNASDKLRIRVKTDVRDSMLYKIYLNCKFNGGMRFK